MNVDEILRVFNECGVEYLLIGGMNFLLRHQPVLTYDIDLWIRDTPMNRAVRCGAAGSRGRVGADGGRLEKGGGTARVAVASVCLLPDEREWSDRRVPCRYGAAVVGGGE